VSGYFNGHPAKGGKVTLTVFMPNATSEHLRVLMAPLVGGLGRIVSPVPEEELQIEGKFTDHNSWEEDFQHTQHKRAIAIGQSAQAEATGTGENKLIASWLWSAQDLTNPRLSQALRGAFDGPTQMMTDATMGVGTHNPPYIRGGGNAINPAMRTAVMRPAAELHWDGTDLRTLAARTQDQLRLGASLRALSPQGGTYPNEADPNIPDWQRAFWGTNYPKLLAIKQKVDPLGVFYCRACVGSEYYEDVAGVLCRKERI
jgi:Berberine and berberine like